MDAFDWGSGRMVDFLSLSVRALEARSKGEVTQLKTPLPQNTIFNTVSYIYIFSRTTTLGIAITVSELILWEIKAIPHTIFF